jgi:glycosyltransferase involved in cell wall biosynthesis
MINFFVVVIIIALIPVIIGSGMFLYRRYKLLWDFIWKIKATQEEIKIILENIKAIQQETQVAQQEIKVSQQATQVTQQATQVTQQATQVTLEKIQVTQQENQVTQQAIQLTQQENQVTQQAIQLTQQENQVTQQTIQLTQQDIQEKLQVAQDNIFRLILQINNVQRAYAPVVNYVDNLRRKEIRRDNLGGQALLSYKERSVLFLHNSYYHFYYLAEALRRRGWDAVSVSYEDPINGPNVNYYHGEDINLFSPDPVKFRHNIEEFFEEAKRRFSLLHFAGDGLMSFFPENWWGKEHPEDIIEWRRLGKKVAYTISGCNSAVAQSTVAEWSVMDEGTIVCDTCIWQNRPDVCNDSRNLAWGKKVDTYCDLIFGETVPALDYLDSPKSIFEPVTMCLDPGVWYPELPIPDQFKIARNEEELLVYHAVGNYDSRTRENGRNIKGTPAVIDAIEQLKAEGFPVRLIFVTGLKNIEVRYIQAQADVIVDQLNYGRYGATAREGMMLGKPVICYINKYEKKPNHKLSCFDDIPLVSASEKTVYEAIKNLLLDQEKRLILGRKSREYALKWHSPDACAERYEQIYDNLMSGQKVSAIAANRELKLGSF